MAILKVAQMGHPVLRGVADPVEPELINTAAFQRFCDDLLETMNEYEGAGLAAPQVHQPIRVVVLTLSDDRGPEFFVNPVVTPQTDETERYYEGCLSVPEIRAAVDRPARVLVEALDRYGNPKAYELEGFPAIVVQHEFDHLDGILFVDRCDTSTLAFLTEYHRFGPLDDLSDEPSFDHTDDDFDDDDLETEFAPLPHAEA